MKVLAAAVPLLIAVFGFVTSRVFVSRRRRLRSGIEADLALWEMLPEDAAAEKAAFLKMIKGKVRQVVSEEGDFAYFDRVAAPVLIGVALVGGLFAGVALLGKEAGVLWILRDLLVGGRVECLVGSWGDA